MSADGMNREEPEGIPPMSHPSDAGGDYRIISYGETEALPADYKRAAHVMIYALDDTVVFGYHVQAAVMMQMRFDGLLGFPGGLVDEGESPLQAVNRECDEEIGLDLSRFCFCQSDHSVSFVHPVKKLVLHFYVKKVTLEDFKYIEISGLKSPDYGKEVLGIIRAPLYTMEEGYLGFPAFLAQNFAGNSRDQLLHALKQEKILPSGYIDKSLAKAYDFMKKRSQ